MNITGGKLQNEKDIEIWYNIMKKDPLREVYNIKEDTWGFDYLFTEKDLFEKIEKYENIEKFGKAFNKNIGQILNWLNDLYKFLDENHFKNCLKQYKLIPNENRIFKKADELFRNKSNENNKIPAIIRPIYQEIYNKDIYDIIIKEEINLEYLKDIQEKNLVDVFNEFSNFFKEEGNEEEKKEYLCNKFITFDINDDKIKQMFIFRKDIDSKYENEKKEKLIFYLEKHNIWKEVQEFWFNYHPKQVEDMLNIGKLADILEDYSDNNEKTFKWINDYIKFLKDNSTITEKYEIFPDQNGNLKSINDLRYENDIPEILKDYDNELHQITDEDYDIRDTLLSRKIESYHGYNRISQKEIIGDIETLFNTKEVSEIKVKIAEDIMLLLPESKNEKYTVIRNALNDIVKYYNKIYNKSLLPKNVNITTELNYGMFITFLLDRIFKKIELMEEKEISNNIDTIPL